MEPLGVSHQGVHVETIDTTSGSKVHRTWLRTPQVAKITGLATRTLNKLRVVGGGPPFIKLGRAVVYDTEDLNEWMRSKRALRSTSSR